MVQAILIKDDYEKYYREHAQFITALSGDLISKTFLFIGFSFSDPNIDYILSRVRIDYGEQNNRQHYAIMRRVNEKDYNNRAEYEYAQRKHEFFIEDLKRYNIRARDKCKTYDWLNGSYITFVEEETFMDDPEKYINNAYDKSENDASGYDLVKQR